MHRGTHLLSRFGVFGLVGLAEVMHGSLAVQSVVLVESGWVVGLVGLRTHLVDVFVFECHVSPPHPNWYFVLTTFRELLSPIMYGLPCHIVRYPIDIYLVELPVVV